MRSTSYPGLPTREITARVRSVANTHAWAKAGVMFRQSPPIAGSQHVMVVVTPGKGVSMQYRPEYNMPSVQIAVRAGVAPEWVRLTQVEGTFKGYTSDDGVTWQLLGSITVDWSGEPGLSCHESQQLGSDHGGVRERAAAFVPQSVDLMPRRSVNRLLLQLLASSCHARQRQQGHARYAIREVRHA